MFLVPGSSIWGQRLNLCFIQAKPRNGLFGFSLCFITPDDNREDLFVHHSRIKDNSGNFRNLGEGETVEFEIEHGNDGRTNTVNVTSLDEGPV